MLMMKYDSSLCTVEYSDSMKKFTGSWMLYLNVPINAILYYSFFMLKMFSIVIQGSFV